MRKWLTSLLIAFLCLSMIPVHDAFARGGGFGGGGGHSFGGSFSGGHSSGGGLFGGHSGFSGSGSRTIGGSDGGTISHSSSGSRSIFGGSSTNQKGYSTPRPDVSKSSISGGYASGKATTPSGKTYSSGSGSFSGSGSRTVAGKYAGSGRTVYSSGYRGYSLSGSPYYYRSPVSIWGYAPMAPLYYHNWYWGLPFYMHWFFTPTYYGGFGYHFFAPNFTVIFITLAIIAIMIALMRRRY